MLQPDIAQRPSTPGLSHTWPVIVSLFLAFLLVGAYVPLTRAVEDGVNGAEAAYTRWSLSGWNTLKSSHFDVYYPPGEERSAQLVLRILRSSLPFEERNLNQFNPGRLTVVVYPSLSAMNQATGEPAHANNIGYDYHGVIDILSPSTWRGTGAGAFHGFAQQGPVPHELGHALLDLKAGMNYPAWFNEGVAQYEDYRLTGYEWLTPTNALTGRLYSMAQLDGNFYGLSNQSLAYREGFSLVQYLETVKGHQTFVRFLDQLSHGIPFNQALVSIYHFPSPAALYHAWRLALDHR